MKLSPADCSQSFLPDFCWQTNINNYYCVWWYLSWWMWTRSNIGPFLRTAGGCVAWPALLLLLHCHFQGNLCIHLCILFSFLQKQKKNSALNQDRNVSVHQKGVKSHQSSDFEYLYLVAFLKVFHQDSHYNVHQHKLGHQYKGDKVHWRHPGQVCETLSVLWTTLP